MGPDEPPVLWETMIFGQIKDRVKGLPLADAVLEVNHWCHERVTYRGSDMRTSAPLATLIQWCPSNPLRPKCTTCIGRTSTR